MWAVLVSGIGYASFQLGFRYLLKDFPRNAPHEWVGDYLVYLGVGVLYLPGRLLEFIVGETSLLNYQWLIPIYVALFYFPVFYAAILLWRAHKRKLASQVPQPQRSVNP
jgi:hypothetical protein